MPFNPKRLTRRQAEVIRAVKLAGEKGAWVSLLGPGQSGNVVEKLATNGLIEIFHDGRQQRARLTNTGHEAYSHWRTH